MSADETVFHQRPNEEVVNKVTVHLKKKQNPHHISNFNVTQNNICKRFKRDISNLKKEKKIIQLAIIRIYQTQ